MPGTNEATAPQEAESVLRRVYRRLLRYVLVCGIVAAATLIRASVDPLIHDQIPYFIYVAAVVVASWYCEVDGGILSVVLASFVGNYFFVTPRYEFVPHGDDWVAMSLFWIVGAGLVALVGRGKHNETLRAAAERHRLLAEAEHRHAGELRLRSDALERTNRELAFRTQENETFVYSVSHDLRSPLVNLQGFTKELKNACQELQEALGECELTPIQRQRIDGLIDADMHSSIEYLQTAVSRLASIVDALLRLSRAGRIQYVHSDVELSATIDRIVKAMRISVEERGAEIAVAPLPIVSGDPTAIEQVFANLIANAVNYLDPERPGRIQVGVAPRSAADEPGTVTVYVRDNGLGIPSAHLGKLFVPFERLHGHRVKGEGVGLALVKRIIDRHGGRIWVESIDGAGTSFFVSLRTPSPTTAPRQSDAPAAAGRA